MPPRSMDRAAQDLLAVAAAELSRCASPDSAAPSLISALTSCVPGLSVWVLQRSDLSDTSCVWAASPEPPPFPESLLLQRDSAAASVFLLGTPLEIDPQDRGRRQSESPYLRRRTGCWWFLPTAESAPAGVVVLHHASLEKLEIAREPISVAARLIQPYLAQVLLRRDTARRIEERTSELALFYETSRALASAKTAEEIASLLGQHLGPALGLDMLALLALHPEKPELFLEVMGSPSGAAIRQFRRAVVKEAGPLPGDGRRRVVLRLRRSARRATGEAAADGSDMHLPLSVQGRPVGVLSVRTRRGRLEELRTRLLYTISNQAALTLERVRAVEEAGLLKIRAVLDSMNEGVLLVDPDLGVDLANPAARRHVETILGAPILPRLARLGNVVIAPIVEALAAGGPPPGPVEILVEESQRIFQLSASPAQGLKGAFEGAVLVLSDVTDQRRLQENLHQAEKLSSLGEMISGVAHELNNPLASIIGFAQLLDQRDLEADVARKISSISCEASRCHGIVQNLLRFARKEEPERRPVDLNSVIGSVVQLLGYQLQVDNITVDVDLGRDMRPILGDYHLLQQVFVNIVHNAHQAMREKGGRGILRIVTRCIGLTCRVELTDTGPGIKPEHLKRIFDPFFSTKGVGQGTGLGLSIAYGAVKEHGGEIHARSRPGRGATFVIDIPACAATEEAATAAPVVEAPAAARPAAGKRILVVEDEISVAEMMREALMAEGHVVDCAGDGAMASEMMRCGRYDLVISDLKMPNMSGRELYEEVLKVDPPLARKIIFSTGDSVSAETQAFFTKTGNPYLTKPFNLRDLYRVVNLALSRA